MDVEDGEILSDDCVPIRVERSPRRKRKRPPVARKRTKRMKPSPDIRKIPLPPTPPFRCAVKCIPSSPSIDLNVVDMELVSDDSDDSIRIISSEDSLPPSTARKPLSEDEDDEVLQLRKVMLENMLKHDGESKDKPVNGSAEPASENFGKRRSRRRRGSRRDRKKPLELSQDELSPVSDVDLSEEAEARSCCGSLVRMQEPSNRSGRNSELPKLPVLSDEEDEDLLRARLLIDLAMKRVGKTSGSNSPVTKEDEIIVPPAPSLKFLKPVEEPKEAPRQNTTPPPPPPTEPPPDSPKPPPPDHSPSASPAGRLSPFFIPPPPSLRVMKEQVPATLLHISLPPPVLSEPPSLADLSACVVENPGPTVAGPVEMALPVQAQSASNENADPVVKKLWGPRKASAPSAPVDQTKHPASTPSPPLAALNQRVARHGTSQMPVVSVSNTRHRERLIIRINEDSSSDDEMDSDPTALKIDATVRVGTGSDAANALVRTTLVKGKPRTIIMAPPYNPNVGKRPNQPVSREAVEKLKRQVAEAERQLKLRKLEEEKRMLELLMRRRARAKAVAKLIEERRTEVVNSGENVLSVMENSPDAENSASETSNTEEAEKTEEPALLFEAEGIAEEREEQTEPEETIPESEVQPEAEEMIAGNVESQREGGEVGLAVSDSFQNADDSDDDIMIIAEKCPGGNPMIMIPIVTKIEADEDVTMEDENAQGSPDGAGGRSSRRTSDSEGFRFFESDDEEESGTPRKEPGQYESVWRDEESLRIFDDIVEEEPERPQQEEQGVDLRGVYDSEFFAGLLAEAQRAASVLEAETEACSEFETELDILRKRLSATEKGLAAKRAAAAAARDDLCSKASRVREVFESNPEKTHEDEVAVVSLVRLAGLPEKEREELEYVVDSQSIPEGDDSDVSRPRYYCVAEIPRRRVSQSH